MLPRSILFLVALLPLEGIASTAWAQSKGTPEILVDSGHSLPVNSIAFAPNGQWIATSGDSTIKLWDVSSGHLLRTLSGHSGQIHSISLSADGRRIVSNSTYDRTIRIWDAESGELLHSLSRRGDNNFMGLRERYFQYPKQTVFARDGRMIFTAMNYEIVRWDVTTGRELSSFQVGGFGRGGGPEQSPESIALSPDGRWLVLGYSHNQFQSPDALIAVWDAVSGKMVRSIGAHHDVIRSIAISPDGRWIVSGSSDKTVKLWDLASGQLLRTFGAHTDQVFSVAFSPDGRWVASAGGDKTIRIWNAATGQLSRTIELDYPSAGVAYSPDGRLLASGGSQGATLWDVDKSAPVRSLPASKGYAYAYIVAAPDNRWVMSSPAGLSIWDGASGQPIGPYQKLGRTTVPVEGPTVLDGQGRWLVPQSDGPTASVWDLKSGQKLGTFQWSDDQDEYVTKMTVSPDGRWLAIAAFGKRALELPKAEQSRRYGKVKLFDVASGQLARTLSGHPSAIGRIVFSPDGRFLASTSVFEPVRVWDPASGKLIREIKTRLPDADATNFSTSGSYVVVNSESKLDRATSTSFYEMSLVDVTTGRASWSTRQPDSALHTAVSPDGKVIVSTYFSTIVKVWDATNGRQIRTLDGNPGIPNTVMFSRDGQKIAVGNSNGTSAVWNAATGELLTTSVHAPSGEWVTITPEGFFVASDKGGELLHVVQAFETTSIDQVYQSLYRPDLVREKLAGDPQGKVREAAAKLDLTKVIASGAAPKVSIVSPVSGSTNATDEVTVDAEIADQGGGIGRIEWRVNGLTLGIEERGLGRVDTRSSGAAREPMKIRRSLALEPGDNVVEIVAYNGRNLIASEPARTTIKWDGAQTTTPPKLHVLAIGVNDYWDSRLKLSYAVPDAKTLADGLAKAGPGLYQSVEVTTALDAEVTIANLDKVFAEMAKKVHARDVFVFFLAGHGKTVDGKYYFLPRDFRYDGEDSIVKKGIDQDRFQAWFARIAARKSILLYDTCESGSLTGDRVQQRGIERVAALDKMTRAMGRTVLSASSDDAPALEGYRGHGVFTYVVLEALGAADTNGNGLIEVTELAAHVDQKVPELSFAAFKLRQVPQMKIVGSNFPLLSKTALLPAASEDPATVIPAKPTHVVIAPAQVRQSASESAPVVIQLTAGTQVRLMESAGGWVLVARDGKKLGYVDAKAILALQ